MFSLAARLLPYIEFLTAEAGLLRTVLRRSMCETLPMAAKLAGPANKRSTRPAAVEAREK
jgi:hypothetical protein